MHVLPYRAWFVEYGNDVSHMQRSTQDVNPTEHLWEILDIHNHHQNTK